MSKLEKMNELTRLAQAAELALEVEVDAKNYLERAKNARADAVREFNEAALSEAGYKIGESIVEVPRRGVVEVLGVTGGSVVQLGYAYGRVVTNSDKFHKGKYRMVPFKIDEARPTGRKIDSEN